MGCKVLYTDMWGTRREKYAALNASDISSTSWKALNPNPPNFLFIPVETDLEDEFQQFYHIYDVFGRGNRKKDNHVRYGAGFVTQQDQFAVAFEPQTLFENIEKLLDASTTEESIRNEFRLCSTSQWSFNRARRELPHTDITKKRVQILYRPFDYRYTVFDRNVCTILRTRIMRHFEEPNLALLTTRRITRLPFNNIFATDKYPEYKVASHDRNTIVFPLYIYPDSKDLFEEKKAGSTSGGRRSNFAPAFIEDLSRKLGLSFVEDGTGDLREIFGPEDVFHYAYAVFHSPAYRARYAEFMKIDFPRLPLTANLDLFQSLCEKGEALVGLHLLETVGRGAFETRYPVPGDNEIAKGYPKYKAPGQPAPGAHSPAVPEGRIYINLKQYFDNVAPDVWTFYVGGYQVLDKWLKDRRGRCLTYDDLTHYQQIVVALRETIRLMEEIDDMIEQYGGWPLS